MMLATKLVAGQGVRADLREATMWLREASEQGQPGAAEKLDDLMRLPMVMPGTPVMVAGLSARPQLNGRVGTVHGLPSASRPGRVTVLLDGETSPVSIREGNLRKLFLEAGGGGPTDRNEALRLNPTTGFWQGSN